MTPSGWARASVGWVEDGGSHNPLEVADYGRDPVSLRRQRLCAPASTNYIRYFSWIDLDPLIWDVSIPVWLLNFLFYP